MSKDSQFTWLGETTFTRSYGKAPSSVLAKGQTYDTSNFPAEVVAEWVRTGNAKYSGKAGKEETNG